MLIIPPTKYRAKRRTVRDATSGGVPPVLVSATFNGGPSLTLTFDQPVDATLVDSSAFLVNDGVETLQLWVGSGAYLISDTSILMELSVAGTASVADVELTVWSNNGVRAVQTGLYWTGIGGLVLPYGG